MTAVSVLRNKVISNILLDSSFCYETDVPLHLTKMKEQFNQNAMEYLDIPANSIPISALAAMGRSVKAKAGGATSPSTTVDNAVPSTATNNSPSGSSFNLMATIAGSLPASTMVTKSSINNLSSNGSNHVHLSMSESNSRSDYSISSTLSSHTTSNNTHQTSTTGNSTGCNNNNAYSLPVQQLAGLSMNGAIGSPAASFYGIQSLYNIYQPQQTLSTGNAASVNSAMTSAAATSVSSIGNTAASNPQPVVVPIFNQVRLSPTSFANSQQQAASAAATQTNTNAVDHPLGYMTEEEFLAKQHLQFSALLASASLDNNTSIMSVSLPSASYECMNDVRKIQPENRHAKQEIEEDEDDGVEEIVEKVDDLVM